MKTLQVGVTKIVYLNDRGKKKKRYALYRDVLFDKDLWADALIYFPETFSIMYLKCQGLTKIYPGWWTGHEWSGLRLPEDAVVIAWKRRPEDVA